MIPNIKGIAIVVVVAVAIGGYQHWQLGKLRDSVVVLTANNAQLTNSVGEQSATIGTLQSSLADTIDNNNRLAERLGVIDTHRRAQVRELNQYRGRLNEIALQKPTLIEYRANDAISRVLRELAEAVGN